MLYSSLFLAVLACFAFGRCSAFRASPLRQVQHGQRGRALFMGRAAAVRAKTKATTDAAKAKNNNRYAKKIIMACKAGGTDPAQNLNLARVLAEAKSANVPQDVVKRNIEKAAKADTADFTASLFEFVGQGGVGLLVNVLTDNSNRAANDINLVGKKHNLKAGGKGSVAFSFDRMSRIDVAATLQEDELLELCLEAGVDDYRLHGEADGNPTSPQDEGHSAVFCANEDMGALRDALQAAGHPGVKAGLQYMPKDLKTAAAGLREEHFEANLAAIEALEALDDVDTVDHDMDLSDD